jgi:hypothetical protein
MPSESLPPADEALLDELFDHALAGLATGVPIDLAQWLIGRPHLRAAAEAVLATARGVVVGTAPRLAGGGLPEVAGYRLLAEVGRGSMGIVYRAVQESLGRVVALKVLAPALFVSSRARERFAAEAQALARVQHPSVVTVHEVVVQPELCAYAMEWLAGPTLARAIEPGGHGLEPLRVAQLGAALARALEAVHAAGVVHRDVKPSNVLLCSDGRTVLTDFGLAHSDERGQGTASGEFLGTAAYAAPEQLRGEREHVGPRSDVYSLGVTLYTALSGQVPFGMATPTAVLRRIESGQVEPLARLNPAVPRDLATVVGTAMDPDRSRRYASAAAFAEDLERFLAHRPILARRAGPWLRGQRWVQRNPWLFAAMVVLALGATTSTWFGLAAREQASHNARLAAEKTALATAESAAKVAAETNAAEARQRAGELEQVLAFQEAQWAAVDPEALGLALRASLLDAVAPEQRDGLASGVAAVDFTNLAVGVLDEQVFTRALTAIEGSFAGPAPVKARLLHNVAVPLRDLGRLARALAPQQQAFELATATLGAAHPASLAARLELVHLLLALGRPADAAAHARIVYETCRTGSGEADRQTLLARKALALALVALGQLEEAKVHAAAVAATARGASEADEEFVISCLAAVRHVQAGARRTAGSRSARA